MMQQNIDNIVKEVWTTDECPPNFILSVMDYDKNAKIMLTIEHLGYKFTDVLFPKEGINYNNGFNVYDEMKQLYNRTM